MGAIDIKAFNRERRKAFIDSRHPVRICNRTCCYGRGGQILLLKEAGDFFTNEGVLAFLKEGA